MVPTLALEITKELSAVKYSKPLLVTFGRDGYANHRIAPLNEIIKRETVTCSGCWFAGSANG
jgi:hypothetical protein